LAVHARTLELYEQLGLAEPVVVKGYTVPGFRLWIGGREAARVPFEEIVSGLTPYGFLHIFPQDEHERLLIERLQDFGVQVERSTELLGYAEEGDHIGARLRGPDGAESTVTAAFIAGCDGAKSKVREIMGTGFPGGTYQISRFFRCARSAIPRSISTRGVASNGRRTSTTGPLDTAPDHRRRLRPSNLWIREPMKVGPENMQVSPYCGRASLHPMGGEGKGSTGP
jgi:2-polyprenyl-6-methoxyphenol hydroxylase-like FAD-dependent oxidoreductase